MPQLILPTSFAVTQPYGCTSYSGEPRDPSCPGGFFHHGIDYAFPMGTTVQAPASGTIASAGLNDGYGNAVVIDTGDGYHVLLGHLESIGVRVGQAVSAGDPLGLSGSTGNSTGPHLHLEVDGPNGQSVDPTAYLGGASNLNPHPSSSVVTSQGPTATPNGCLTQPVAAAIMSLCWAVGHYLLRWW